MLMQTLSKDFQLLHYHFPLHFNQSSAGLSHRHRPCQPVPLLIRSDGIISAQLINEQIGSHCINEHTVVPIPALLVTGTISSLALLGSLANLHCKDRSKTFLWNLKENRAYEQYKVQVLCKRIPGRLTRSHRTWFNNEQLVIIKASSTKALPHTKTAAVCRGHREDTQIYVLPLKVLKR